MLHNVQNCSKYALKYLKMPKKHILRYPEHKQKNRFSSFFSYLKWPFCASTRRRSGGDFEAHWPEKHTGRAKSQHSKAENMLHNVQNCSKYPLKYLKMSKKHILRYPEHKQKILIFMIFRDHLSCTENSQNRLSQPVRGRSYDI